MKTVEELMSQNNIKVVDQKSAISRIGREFKLEMIREYDELHRQVEGEPITIEQFELILSESNAILQKKIAILSCRLEFRKQMA